MEWLETLLPLILLALYFLSQLGRKRRSEGSPDLPDEPLTTPDRATAGRASPTSFEELIRQIQQAAEETRAAQAPPPPKPTPPPAPKPRPKPKVPHPLVPSVESEFRPVGGFEHDRHGFGLDSPFSEEAFERMPRGTDVTEHAPGHLLQSPHGLFQPAGQPAPKRSHPLAERLSNPGSARDAFALREILDAPRARRRR